MDQVIQSRPFKPKAACEACVFGRGPHADWCEAYKVQQILDRTLPLRSQIPEAQRIPVVTCPRCGKRHLLNTYCTCLSVKQIEKWHELLARSGNFE